MTLNETLKSLGLPENPTKDQILKILSDSNLKQLESLLSDPAMGDELKEKIKGALGEYADLSQGPQPRRIERVGDGVMKDAHTSPDNEGPGDSQIEKLDATQAALQLPNDPNITRFTIFDPRNTCRSAQEVAEIHKATGLEILPKGNVLDPENGNIGVELISFRPQRIAQQLTIAAVNMQAQINEENFPTTVDNILKNYIAKEMETVTPQIEAIRSGIASNVQMALRALNQAPDMDLSGTSETVKKVKAAKDLVQGRINAEEYQPTSQEAVDNAISSYVTDLIYNDSSEVFNLIGKAVDRGMQQALEAKAYKPLPVGPNSERVAIVVAGGPASGKTKASQIALESVPEHQAMSFSTDQLRTMVSPKGGSPAFTDQEANLIFRQVIGKVDSAMKQGAAPTILSEGTGLNPGAIGHLLTGEGTKVGAYLISIPAEEALKRASSRSESADAKDQGRSYSDEYLLGLHKQDGITLLNVADQLKGRNVKLSILDNNVEKGTDPKVAAEIDFKSGEMIIYDIEALAKIEQKAKLDPKQQKDQGMYDTQDTLPENNMSFLTKALEDFEVTFKDGKDGKEYASSKPREELQISDQGLFDSKEQNPYDKLLSQVKDKALAKKPLVIYVAETDHGDMSYSSLLEQIAKDCDAKGLKSQIFSEFPNQTDKVLTQSWSRDPSDENLSDIDRQMKNLRNTPARETHLATTEFLNERLTPMGDLKGRVSMYNKTFEAITQYFSGKSSIGAEDMKMYLNEIDDPDALTLVRAHFEEMKENGTQIPLNQGPFAFYGAIDGPTAIHFKILHEQMAQDVTQKLDPQADVVIMIAGGPHIPGLAAQLDQSLSGSKKIVVGNFQEASNPDSPDFDKIAMFTSGSPRSCAAISGKVTEFEVDPKTKLATVPGEILGALEQESLSQARATLAKACFDKFYKEGSQEIKAITRENGPTPKFALEEFILPEALRLETSKESRDLIAKIPHISSLADLEDIFQHVHLEHLRSIDRDCFEGRHQLTKLPTLQFDGSELSQSTEQTLREYIDDSQFVGTIHISQKSSSQAPSQEYSSHRAHSKGLEDDTPFCIHSVGKVFTGVLAVKMLQTGVLTEEQLSQPVELNEATLEKLPIQLQEHLKTVTLGQLMTHRGGLSDYLDNYENAIMASLAEGSPPPEIKELADFLQYADAKVSKIGQEKYSNLGLLLVGDAIEHAYNKHPKNSQSEPLNYHQILQEQILTPSKIALEKFSIQNPGNGCTNPNNEIAPVLSGGPAGGYWTDADSMDKFGKWLVKEWQDPEFQDLAKQYGSEFFDEKTNAISHNGSISSSSAHFKVLLDEGVVSTTLSARPQIAYRVNDRSICEQIMQNHKAQESSQANADQFLMTTIDPDHSYAKHVGDIIANSKNNQGQPFFSEEIRAKSGKLSDEEAARLLPQILELIYEGKPDQKPSEVIDSGSGSGTKSKFFAKIYDDLTSGDYQVQMDQSKVKTIEQFTPKGLDTAVEYYNQKYPDRGKIGRVQLLMDDLLDHRPNLVKKACEDLSTLRKQGCNKIAISIARKNPKSPSGISLDHSTPFVLTNDKLILMRDEHDSFGQPLFEEIAANLGVKFVQSSPPIYDKTDPKRTSIQGDYASCHFIALGVLKDLTKEDLQTVSGFKNGFDHLAKSLKYSQSASHIKNTLDEESAKDPVKKDGRTAEQYAKQHKKVTEDGIATRVNDKFNRFKSTLSETTSDLRGESAISDVAGEVLKEYSAAKAGNAQKSFVEKFNLQPKSREPLAKRKDPESTSYVEKIRAAKDQGRSNGGSNEL